MAKISRSNLSIRTEKKIMNSIALASYNKDTIEYIAMMSDIEIPTSDAESVSGGITDESQQEL